MGSAKGSVKLGCHRALLQLSNATSNTTTGMSTISQLIGQLEAETWAKAGEVGPLPHWGVQEETEASEGSVSQGVEESTGEQLASNQARAAIAVTEVGEGQRADNSAVEAILEDAKAGKREETVRNEFNQEALEALAEAAMGYNIPVPKKIVGWITMAAGRVGQPEQHMPMYTHYAEDYEGQEHQQVAEDSAVGNAREGAAERIKGKTARKKQRKRGGAQSEIKIATVQNVVEGRPTVTPTKKPDAEGKPKQGEASGIVGCNTPESKSTPAEQRELWTLQFTPRATATTMPRSEGSKKGKRRKLTPKK